MPYTRPERKGLPNPTSEDGENSLKVPLSESHRYLSDLVSADGSSQIACSKSMFQLKSNPPARHESKEVNALSRPERTPPEHSPPKSDRVDKLSLGEGHAKSSSRRSLKVLKSPLLAKHQNVLTKLIVQMIDSDN